MIGMLTPVLPRIARGKVIAAGIVPASACMAGPPALAPSPAVGCMPLAPAGPVPAFPGLLLPLPPVVPPDVDDIPAPGAAPGGLALAGPPPEPPAFACV